MSFSGFVTFGGLVNFILRLSQTFGCILSLWVSDFLRLYLMFGIFTFLNNMLSFRIFLLLLAKLPSSAHPSCKSYSASRRSGHFVGPFSVYICLLYIYNYVLCVYYFYLFELYKEASRPRYVQSDTKLTHYKHDISNTCNTKSILSGLCRHSLFMLC